MSSNCEVGSHRAIACFPKRLTSSEMERPGKSRVLVIRPLISLIEGQVRAMNEYTVSKKKQNGIFVSLEVLLDTTNLVAIISPGNKWVLQLSM